MADFFLYLDQVELSIAEQFGPACDSAIRQGYDATISLLKDPSLIKTFNLCAAPQSELDVANFLSSVAGSIMGVGEFNFELFSLLQIS